MALIVTLVSVTCGKHSPSLRSPHVILVLLLFFFFTFFLYYFPLSFHSGACASEDSTTPAAF